MVEVPARGTFIWLNFEPQSGREQMGRRPALVVSHTAFNRKRGFAFVCPISNTRRKNPFYIAIPEGLAVTGVIMCDQLRSLDYRIRNAEFLGECPISLLEEVLLRIQPIFL
ncbi:MAG: Endoribonuclease toxin MazF [Chroococcidiopsis cubana SAG 39.79]|uniref:Transcriptional modulator of MazE/toxin, MazF n=2 Tax=Chroococcidiopsis TaxID=54298 RepID=K9U349_CHRTP|nr:MULTISPECIES: type II toxin-antitoxin system PemK/MazF family toxin [Chroococcidiopsis]PSB46331.1 type II toxin-antitoxin system PemK/MazF family toxin [Cyanosarcina cf. burmensis CCALA 770]AFY88841.1 transcriptional modulator of MazE/toxin, MazF [Chroococcidiopsis thermalis PCC 7203]MDZ4871314.1 Endoribonuclease toxin MazF [Chroococcidiopsis cubana SAG 39.79]PSB63026.1 type II toxin-antitoxin system PemK/MazF family toxin [Chroococcidiopsis cubana CCALA 043]RUT11925.1 potassium-transportin